MGKKYVVLADIESVRVPYTAFSQAMEELSNYGEIATCKFYGYSAKRTKDYKPFITANYYEALPPIKHKRKGKLDLRQVIDAVNISNNSAVDGFFLMYGQGDFQPLISWLKAAGYEVIAGVIEPDANSALCTAVIKLDGTGVKTNTAYKKVVAAEEAPRVPKSKVADTGEADADILAQLDALLKS